MYLQDGTRTHFMRFLEQEFPSLRPRYEKLYAKKYPPEAYRKEVQGDGRCAPEQHGLLKRRRPTDKGEEPDSAQQVEQAAFAW